jgi:hypothetical protein
MWMSALTCLHEHRRPAGTHPKQLEELMRSTTLTTTSSNPAQIARSLLKRAEARKARLGFVPKKHSEHFNPAHFASGLDEKVYPHDFRLGGGLTAARNRLVEWLRKKYGDDPACMKLAARLEACKPDDRCRSLACPRCSNAAQALTTDIVARFLAAHPDRKNIVCVSIVPWDGVIPKGQLDAEQHARHVRRWKERLGRAGVTSFLGATDWSFNEHDDQRYQSSWQEHLYGFTVTDDPKKLKKELKRLFLPTDAIPRPVKIEAWDGDETAIQYMMKPTFWRRIGRDDAERWGKDGKGNGESRGTDKQPLKSSQKRELLLHLDEIGVQGRFLLRWLQFVHLATAGWTLADRTPKGRMRGNGKTP